MGIIYFSNSYWRKIMFAGVHTTPLSRKVSIYDVPTKTCSSHGLCRGRLGISACRVDKFAVFAGGSFADNGATGRLDAMKITMAKWYSMKPPPTLITLVP